MQTSLPAKIITPGSLQGGRAVLNEGGYPSPPSHILKLLKAVDPRLSMLLIPPGNWAFIERWGPNDTRRQMIQRGEMSPKADFDMLGIAPPNVSVEDAHAILEKGLRQRPNTKDDYNAMLNNLLAHNASQVKENAAPVREFAAEMLDANAAGITGRITSRQGGFSKQADGSIVGTARKVSLGRTAREREATASMGDL